MTTGSHEQVPKLSTENTAICMGLPTGSGMCEHQEGQRGPVTDGKGGGLSGPSPFVSPVEMRGWLWRGICDPQQQGIFLDILPNTLQCMFPSSFKESLPLHTLGPQES